MSGLLRASREAATDLESLLDDLDADHWPGSATAMARLAKVREEFAALVERTWPEGEESVRDSLAAVWSQLADSPDGRFETWVAFRARCEPPLHALLAVLTADSPTGAGMRRPHNLVRNAYHVANAVGVVLLVEVVLPDSFAWRAGVAIAAASAAWGMEISRRLFPGVNTRLMRLFGPVAHAHEAESVNSATWYATAILALALFFPVHAGAAGLMALGLGDPAAALIGRRFGRHRLANGRSLEGAMAFAAAGFVGAFWALSMWHPGPPDLLVGQAMLAACAGAAAELLVRRIDDNLAVPLAAAAAVALLGGP